MPIVASVDPTTNRLCVVADGILSYAEIVAHLTEERDAGDLALSEFVDATRARLNITSAEVRSIVELLRTFQRATVLGPTAVLVCDDASYGMLRVMEMLVDETCDIRPFRRLGDAEQWLEQWESSHSRPDSATH